MINRLRAKFIALTMALITVLLAVIFSTICQATWLNLENETSRALRTATFESWRPGSKDGDGENPSFPCFALYVNNSCDIVAIGHAYYDLSDKELLREILQEAQATGKSEAILKERNLKFLKLDLWMGEKYIFADISSQIKTMKELISDCTVIFWVAWALFFGVIWWLSGRMLRPVEKAWEQQKQFVADASHELKTPLTVILTGAELLQNGEHDEATNRRLAGSLYTMAHRMWGLVENLLDLARVDNHQLRQQMCRVNLSDLVENSILHFEPVYFESGLELVSAVQPELMVRGSEQHLRQVVDILLDNGCKYAAQGTQVELTLQASRKHCILQVRSRGETLTPQQCKDVFKRFYRVDEARSKSGSYGLGLSIAQGIVREHGGKIWAQGKDGVNTFFVSLAIRESKK